MPQSVEELWEPLGEARTSSEGYDHDQAHRNQAASRTSIVRRQYEQIYAVIEQWTRLIQANPAYQAQLHEAARLAALPGGRLQLAPFQLNEPTECLFTEQSRGQAASQSGAQAGFHRVVLLLTRHLLTELVEQIEIHALYNQKDSDADVINTIEAFRRQSLAHQGGFVGNNETRQLYHVVIYVTLVPWLCESSHTAVREWYTHRLIGCSLYLLEQEQHGFVMGPSIDLCGALRPEDLHKLGESNAVASKVYGSFHAQILVDARAHNILRIRGHAVREKVLQTAIARYARERSRAPQHLVALLTRQRVWHGAVDTAILEARICDRPDAARQAQLHNDELEGQQRLLGHLQSSRSALLRQGRKLDKAENDMLDDLTERKVDFRLPVRLGADKLLIFDSRTMPNADIWNGIQQRATDISGLDADLRRLAYDAHCMDWNIKEGGLPSYEFLLGPAATQRYPQPVVPAPRSPVQPSAVSPSHLAH